MAEEKSAYARFHIIFGFEPVPWPAVPFDRAGVEIVQRGLRRFEAEAVVANAASIAARQRVEKSPLCSMSEQRLCRLRKKWFRLREKAVRADALSCEARQLAAQFNYLSQE